MTPFSRLLNALRPAALGLVLLGVPGPARSQAPDPAGVLERAAERYEGVRALCANFEQVIDVALLRETRRSEGVLCQQQPNLFSMEFSDPPGDRVVADGEWLWIYYPSMDPGQVMRSPLSVSGGRFDFYREFLEDPGLKYRPAYVGIETVGGHATHVLTLVPTTPSAYREATVWIDRESDLIRKVEILEESGSTRTVTLSDLRLDPQLDSGTFSFTPPPGTRIIER